MSKQAMAKGGGANCCEVDFSLVDLRKEDIPGIDGYEEALESARAAWEKRGNKDVVRYLNSLNFRKDREAYKALVVRDNGVGFNVSSMEAILSEGTPTKKEGSSGSFGVGHLTAFALSGLQYLLYVGKSPEATLFAGHAILSSHPGKDGKTKSAHGYCVKEIDNDFFAKYKYYSEKSIPKVLRKECDKIEKAGSMVVALDFNWFADEDSNDEGNFIARIEEAVIANFAMAICSGRLKVKINNGNVIEAGNLQEIIDRQQVDDEVTLRTIENIKTYKRSCDTQSEEGKEGYLAGEFEDCKILLRNRADKHGVSFWRNGMLITRSHRKFSKPSFAESQAFDAVIMLEGIQNGRDPVSHDLVRKAETPMHDQIVTSRLVKPTDRKKINDLFDEIRAWLKEQAEPLSLDKFGLDDILLQNGESREFFIFDTSTTRTTSARDGKNPDSEAFPNGQGSGNGEGVERDPVTQGKGNKTTRQPTDVSPKIKQQGYPISPKEWNLRFKPQSDFESMQVRISASSGSDPSCVGSINEKSLKISKVTVSDKEGKQIACTFSDNVINLGRVDKDNKYDMEMVFENELHTADLDKSIDAKFTIVRGKK